MTNKIFFSTVLFVLFFSATVFGSTYYIDASNGNDSNNGLSPSAAWKTLNKLNNSWAIFKPGDNILFKRGEVWAPSGMSRLINPPQNGGLHGTESQRITFGAYGTGAKPVISSQNSSGAAVIYARNISYVTFENLEFRGRLSFEGSLSFPNKIAYLKLLHLTIDGTQTGGGIDFYAPAVEGAAEQWNQSEIHHIELGYSLIRNVTGSGIQLYGQGYNWIHHNEIYNTGRTGVNFAEGNNNVVEYNIISGTYGPGIKHSVHSNTAKNLIIRGNLILRAQQGGIAAYNLINAKIYNNTIRAYGNEAALFGWTTQTPVPLSGLGSTGFDNNYIENNIFYGGIIYLWKSDGAKITYKDGTVINYYQEDVWVDNFFRKNIIRNPNNSNQINFRDFVPGTHVYYSSSAPGTYAHTLNVSDYNVKTTDFNSAWANHGNVTDLNVEPQFVNDFWSSPENFGDFRLKSSSPAIGAGVPVQNFTADLNGNSVNGSNPDIGAFQSGSAVSLDPGDLTAPALTNAEITNANTVRLTFSEKLSSSTATNASNYVITTGSAAESNSGANLFAAGKGSYENGIESWVAYGNNQVSSSTDFASSGSRSLKISYSNHSGGAYLYLSPKTDLTTGLTVGKEYIVSFSARLNSGSADVAVTGGSLSAINTPVDQTMKRYSVTFTASSADQHYIRTSGLSSGETLYIDDIQISEAGSATFSTPAVNVSGASLSSTGDEVVLSTGDHQANMTYYVAVNNVQDEAGNTISSSNTGSYVLNVVLDTTPPALTSAAPANQNTVNLQFSEALDQVTAENVSNYKITTNSGVNPNLFAPGKGNFEVNSESWTRYGSNSVTSTSEFAVNGSKSLKIAFVNHSGGAYLYLSPTADLGTAFTVGKEYVVSFYAKLNGGEAYVALSGGGLSPINTAIDQTFKKYEVTFTASSADKHYLRASALSAGEALYIDDVQVRETGSAVANVNITGASLNAAGDVVTLTTDAHTHNSNYTVLVSNVEDKAGNVIASDSDSQTYQFIQLDNTPPTLTEAELGDSQTLFLTFSENIDDAQAAKTSNYQVTGVVNNLFSTGKGSFENGTESWKAYGGNVISSSSDYSHDGSRSLAITYKNHTGGAYHYLSGKYDLMEDLKVGTEYVVTFWARLNTGEASVALSGGGLSPVNVPVDHTLKQYEVRFTATSANQHYMRASALSSGETLYIDDLRIKEANATPVSVTVSSAQVTDAPNVVKLVTSGHVSGVEYTVKATNVTDEFSNAISGNNSASYTLDPSLSAERMAKSGKNNNGEEKPETFELFNNYPNPFNPTTVISFALPEKSAVMLKVYNVLGEEVAELVNSELAAGTHRVNFNASNLASGVYIYAIKAGKFSMTKKMVLTK